MCLRELQRSNLFIGILGERYGQSIPAETGAPLSSIERQEKEALLKSFQLASKEFPWVEHFKDRSITEIEMRYVCFHYLIIIIFIFFFFYFLN